MPIDTNEIVVGSTGKIFVAPVGTVAPVDVATAWVAAWIDLGYATEDGVTISKTRDIEDIPAWQSFYPVRKIVTGENFTVSFSLMQWNENTIKLAFGGGTVTTTAGPPAHYLYTPPAAGVLDERALGVEWTDGTKIYRLACPKVILTDAVESNVTRTDAAALPLTFGVIGDAVASPFIIRTNDPAWAA